MHEVTHYITNEINQPREIWMEPWGDTLTLPSHSQFRFVGRSEVEGDLQIDYLPSRIMVDGWPGCTLQVYNHPAGELIRDFNIPFPKIPSGLSMKDFITLLFGDPPPPAESKAKQN